MKLLRIISWLFFIKKNYIELTLIYDFNVEEGDSFHIDIMYSLSYMKVDSIRYLNWEGSTRKHWFFHKSNSDTSSWNRTKWIEGVGQLGLLERPSEIGISGATVKLLCFWENGNLVYHNPDFSSCYIKTSVPFISNNKELISLTPNPATTQLTLSFSENTSNATYAIYDLQGCIQQSGKTSNTLLEINVVTLPRGVFVLKVVTNKQIVIKKIILQ